MHRVYVIKTPIEDSHYYVICNDANDCTLLDLDLLKALKFKNVEECKRYIAEKILKDAERSTDVRRRLIDLLANRMQIEEFELC